MITPKEWKKLKVGDLLYITPPRSTCIKTAKINEVNDKCITIKYDNGRTYRVYPPRTHIFFVNKNDAIECLMLFVKNEIKKQLEGLQKLQNQLEKNMTNNKISDFEKEILNKIDNNDQLTEDEVEELVYSDNIIDSIIICKYRWSEQIQSIAQLGGRTFSIYWRSSLATFQDNLFKPQIPVEVRQIKKMIETTEWVEL